MGVDTDHYTHICPYLCIYVCNIYKHTHVHTRVCVCVCICKYIQIHSNTFTSLLSHILLLEINAVTHAPKVKTPL